MKKTEIRKLIAKEKPVCIFIQESKLEVVDSRLCFSLWGNNDCEWLALPSIGRSGGLISIWKKTSFNLTASFSGPGYLGMSGIWTNGVSCNFINIYSLCDLSGKDFLWQNVVSEIQDRGSDNWCVLGNFNSALDPLERKGSNPSSRREIDAFNGFIEEAGLNNFPLTGRKYTWSSSNGRCMSRIDSFLISEGWISTWPNLIQKGLSISFSDHCPIIRQLS